MRLEAIAGTDIATMVLFWPGRVTQDVRAWPFAEQLEWLDGEQGRGRLLKLPCVSDGSYKLAMFVDEAPPAEFVELCVDEVDLGALHVPDEPAWFGGLEGLCADPANGKHRSAVEPVAIPPGTYHARLSEFDAPDEHQEQWVDGRLGPEARRARDRQDGLLGCGGLLLFGAIGVLVFQGWSGPTIGLGLAALALFVAAAVVARGPGAKELREVRERYEDEFASYLLILERQGD